MLRSRLLWTVAVLAILAVVPARAEPKPPTPAALAGAQVVSAVEAKALAEGKAVFVDARKALNFGKGHIPDALSVPYDEKSGFQIDFDASLDRFDLTRIPANKGTRLVFYSDGPKGWKSYKAAVWALRHGYRQVYWLRGGFDEWNARGYPIE